MKALLVAILLISSTAAYAASDDGIKLNGHQLRTYLCAMGIEKYCKAPTTLGKNKNKHTNLVLQNMCCSYAK